MYIYINTFYHLKKKCYGTEYMRTFRSGLVAKALDWQKKGLQFEATPAQELQFNDETAAGPVQEAAEQN